MLHCRGLRSRSLPETPPKVKFRNCMAGDQGVTTEAQKGPPHRAESCATSRADLMEPVTS